MEYGWHRDGIHVALGWTRPRLGAQFVDTLAGQGHPDAVRLARPPVDGVGLSMRGSLSSALSVELS